MYRLGEVFSPRRELPQDPDGIRQAVDIVDALQGIPPSRPDQRSMPTDPESIRKALDIVEIIAERGLLGLKPGLGSVPDATLDIEHEAAAQRYN